MPIFLDEIDIFDPAIMTTCSVSFKKFTNLSSRKNKAKENKTFLLNDEQEIS